MKTLRKTLRKAVEDHNGIWPFQNSDILWWSQARREYFGNKVELGDYEVCKRHEFEQSVREGTDPKDWYDYVKQEKIIDPPIGTNCEMKTYGDWFPTVIIGEHLGSLIAYASDPTVMYDYISVEPEYDFRPTDWAKDSERGEFIGLCKDKVGLHKSVEGIYAEIYDLIRAGELE